MERCGNYWHPRGRGDVWSTAPALRRRRRAANSSLVYGPTHSSDGFLIGSAVAWRIDPRGPPYNLHCPCAFRVGSEVPCEALHQHFGQPSSLFFGGAKVALTVRE